MSHAGVALVDPYVIFEKVGIKPGMHLADFGCGRTGHFIFSLSRLVGETGVVYAVDILKDVLENIKGRVRSEGYGNIHTVWSDIEVVGKTAIPAEILDGVFFVNVLSRLHSRTQSLQEAARLVRPGGFIVVVEWLKNLGVVGPSAGQMIAPTALSDLLASANLTVVDQQGAGDYHYYAIARKT